MNALLPISRYPLQRIRRASREETVIATLPSEDEDQRAVVVMVHDANGQSTLLIRQESRSDAVGWFEQSRVALKPEQVAGLKAMLGSSGTRLPSSQPSANAPATLPMVS